MKKWVSNLRIEVDQGGMKRIGAKIAGQIYKRGSKWESHCQSLNVYAAGKSKQQAIENMAEAINLFIKSCLDHGTLEIALLDMGWKMDMDISVDGLAMPTVTTMPRTSSVPDEVLPAFVIDKIKNKSWAGHLEL